MALRFLMEQLHNDLLHHKKCLYTPTGLILIIYILSYPKAVSDSMQKEIRHKTNKKKEEMKARSTERKY